MFFFLRELRESTLSCRNIRHKCNHMLCSRTDLKEMKRDSCMYYENISMNLTIQRVEVIRLFTFYLFRSPKRILQASQFPLESLCVSFPVMRPTSFRADLAHEVHLSVSS